MCTLCGLITCATRTWLVPNVDDDRNFRWRRRHGWIRAERIGTQGLYGSQGCWRRRWHTHDYWRDSIRVIHDELGNEPIIERPSRCASRRRRARSLRPHGQCALHRRPFSINLGCCMGGRSTQSGRLLDRRRSLCWPCSLHVETHSCNLTAKSFARGILTATSESINTRRQRSQSHLNSQYHRLLRRRLEWKKTAKSYRILHHTTQYHTTQCQRQLADCTE